MSLLATVLGDGKKLIHSIIAEFQRVETRLHKAIDLCEEKLAENDQAVIKLNQEGRELQDAIDKATIFINNFNKLIGG